MRLITILSLVLLQTAAYAAEPTAQEASGILSDDPDIQALTNVLKDSYWLAGSPAASFPGDSIPRDTLLMDSILYADSVERHFYYAVPESYDPEVLTPLFVWLHGGVSTAELSTMEPGDIDDWVLIPRLLEEGYLIAFPCGQMGATWWDPVGEEGILNIVKWMKFNFTVDDSRVFVGGFSDGASGCFSLMMLHPSPFAGYLAFSGHPGVAALDGDRATYLPSLSNRPGMVTHSDEDGLYPARQMAHSIALAESAGARIEYHTFEGYEHDPSYLPLLEDRIVEWLEETRRERFPVSIVWEAGEPSGCDWLMVDSIIPWPVLTEDVDFNTLMVSERLQFGFYPDWDYQGDGILVSGVAEGDLPASRLGFREGDVITCFQGIEVKGLDELWEVQSGMAPGDSFAITVQRGSESLELRDRFNPRGYYWLLPRQGPSVRVEASHTDNQFDISVNRLCRLGLLLHPEMVDFGRDVTVTCNGYLVFSGRVEPDDLFLLEDAISEGDAEREYQARLELDLEKLLLPMMYADLSD
ncbi:MAG: PDZ domain-containing protein [Candidatus Fermentibacteraceae bacterium]|nr:PDZ domain-containing protein [Candidatus Fermentibacteraceae bacterium]